MPTIVRRAIIAVLLLIAAGATYGVTQLSSGQSKPMEQVIESLIPADGDKTLTQGQIEVKLAAGWTANLSVNQVPIPDEQLSRVPEQGRVTFKTGIGKAIAAFKTGQNCALLTYWQTQTPEQRFTKSWCFTAV